MYYYFLTLSLNNTLAFSNQIENAYRNVYKIEKEFIKDPNFIYELKTDTKGVNYYSNSILKNIDIDKKVVEKFAAKNDISVNVLFLSCILISESIYNNNNKVFLQTIYNGRDTQRKLQTIGFMIHSVPLFVEFENDENLFSIFNKVKSIVNFGFANSVMEYTHRRNLEVEDCLFFNYMKDITNFKQYSFIEQNIEFDRDKDVVDTLVEFNVLDCKGEDKYLIDLKYAKEFYFEQSMERLIRLFNSVIDIVVLQKNPINLKFHNIKHKI